MPRSGKCSANARRGRSGSASSGALRDDDSSDSVHNCVSCAKVVGDGGIGCDKCEHWVHGTEMCSGLPQRVIDAILEYDGRGIRFRFRFRFRFLVD